MDREAQVRELFGSFAAGREAGCAAVQRLFAEGCVWSSPGMPVTTGPAEAIELIERYEGEAGIHSTEMQILNLAVHGDVVLAEHLDHARREDGSSVLEMTAVGVLEFEGEQLVAWREYFDPSVLGGAGQD
jgi:limonene-1,2-epoxide hydrolase